MRRVGFLILGLGWLLAVSSVCVAAAPESETSAQRAARLAQKFAAAPDPAQVQATPAAAPGSVPAVEGRRLGVGSGNVGGPGEESFSGNLPGAGGRGESSGGGWVLDTLTALGLVIAAIFAVKWLARKFGGPTAARPSRAVEVLSRTSIAPRNHVLLLRVGGRVLVVGDSPQGLRPLSEVVAPDEVASLLASVTADRDDSLSSSFSKLISRYGGDYEGREALADEGGDHAEHRTDRARDAVSRLLGRVRSMSGKRGAS